MAISSIATHLISAASVPPPPYFIYSKSNWRLYVSFCDFERLRDLPIEEAINQLKDIVQIDPVFFVCNYDKFPTLLPDQALPLLMIAAEKDPSHFCENYEKFSSLSVEEALPLLRVVAENVPSLFAEKFEKFPTLSPDDAIPLLRIVAENASFHFFYNYEKFPALLPDQALPLLRIAAEKSPSFFCDYYEKYPSLSVREALPLLRIAAKNNPSIFAKNFEKFPTLSPDDALPLLRIVAENASFHFIGNFEKFRIIPVDETLVLLRIVAQKNPSEFMKINEKMSILSADQAISFLAVLAEKYPSGLVLNYEKIPPLTDDQVFALFQIIGRRLSSLGLKVIPKFLLNFILYKFKESPIYTETLTRKFLEGELQANYHSSLIEHIIEYSPFFEAPSVSDIEHMLRNVSKETAYSILAAFINYRPGLFSTHFFLIFTRLTTPFEGDPLPRIDKTGFFELLASAETKIDLEKTCPPIWADFCEFARREEVELRKKDSELWRCIGRKKQTEGYLYTFRFNPESTKVSGYKSTNALIYPAIEPDIDLFAIHLVAYSQSSFLVELGYFATDKRGNSDEFSEHNTITIPDREALLYRYNQLRTLSPTFAHLPELSIISSAGIASDLDFVQGLIDYDGLISEGKEFIHDQIIHIVPLLETAINGSEFYEKVKKAKISWFQSYLKKINFIKEEIKKPQSHILKPELSEIFRKNLPILETLLGALVDTIGSKIFTPELVIENFLYRLEGIIVSDLWIRYLEKRYNFDSSEPEIPKFNQKIIEQLAWFIDRLPRT